MPHKFYFIIIYFINALQHKCCRTPGPTACLKMSNKCVHTQESSPLCKHGQLALLDTQSKAKQSLQLPLSSQRLSLGFNQFKCTNQVVEQDGMWHGHFNAVIIYLSISLSIYLSIYLRIYLSNLSIYVSIYLSIYLSSFYVQQRIP